jgi:hypothetical protein
MTLPVREEFGFPCFDDMVALGGELVGGGGEGTDFSFYFFAIERNNNGGEVEEDKVEGMSSVKLAGMLSVEEEEEGKAEEDGLDQGGVHIPGDEFFEFVQVLIGL